MPWYVGMNMFWMFVDVRHDNFISIAHMCLYRCMWAHIGPMNGPHEPGSRAGPGPGDLDPGTDKTTKPAVVGSETYRSKTMLVAGGTR